MLKYYVKTTEALKRLRTDKDGVVSFEYVIVAACVVGAVAAAFGTGAGWCYRTALTDRDHRDHHRFTRLIGRLTPEGGIGMSQCPTFFEACI